MKKKDSPFTLTEWEWFKIQLKIHELSSRALLWEIAFNFEDEEGKNGIECYIFHKRLGDIFKETTDKNVLLEEYFMGWVESEKSRISEILDKLPVLGKEFDVERDVVFEIMQSYGMGSATVCKIIGKNAEWNKRIYKELITHGKDPVSVLENKLLSKFENFAEYLKKMYSDRTIEVESHEVGILTDWQGHCIEIVCYLPNIPLHLPCEVALSVDVFHLHSNPILTANVVWRKAYISDTSLSFAPTPFSEETLSKLFIALPRLCDIFEEAVERGYPPNVLENAPNLSLKWTET